MRMLINVCNITETMSLRFNDSTFKIATNTCSTNAVWLNIYSTLNTGPFDNWSMGDQMSVQELIM